MQYWINENRVLCVDELGVSVGIIKKGVLKLKAVSEICGALDNGRTAKESMAPFGDCKQISLKDLEKIELHVDEIRISFVGKPEHTMYDATSIAEGKEIWKHLSETYDLKASDRMEPIAEASKGPVKLLLLVVAICGLLTFVGSDPSANHSHRVGRGAGLGRVAQGLGLDGMLMVSFVAVIAVAVYWGLEVLLRDRTRIFTPRRKK